MHGPCKPSSPGRDPSLTKATPGFRLRTLAEHRHATRFEAKTITLQTWPRVLRSALRKLRNGDRIQHVEAFYALLEIAELRPPQCDLTRVWLNIGSVYLSFDHVDEAIRAYRQCLHIDPYNWKARYNAGVALARQRVFAIATTELERARECACPPDVVEQIQELLSAIHTIQSRRNEQAYNATNDARAFTWRYLETLHLLVTNRDGSSRATNHEGSTPTLPPPPSAPLLFEIATGWTGSIASFLHDLHVHASLHGVEIDQEFTRLDETNTGVTSLAFLETLYQRVCGGDLDPRAIAALGSIFPDNAVMVRLLVPNTETLDVIDEMKRDGFFYAGMSWRLTKKRLRRSQCSRSGGLWQWMTLSLEAWLQDVAPQIQLSPEAIKNLPGVLTKLGYPTPMHLVASKSPISGEMIGLPDGNRELVVAEINKIVTAIREEASRVLQMLCRRLGFSKRDERTGRLSRRKRGESATKESKSVNLAMITVREQQETTRSVLETLDELVEAVVASVRAEAYAKVILPSSDTPVRTENRHRLD